MNARSFGCLLLCFCASLFAVPALAVVGGSLPTFSAMAVNQSPIYSALGQPQISVSSTLQAGSRTLPVTATSRGLSQLSRLRLAAAMSVRGNLGAGALLAGSAAAAYYFETNKYYFDEEQYALYSESIEGPVSGVKWQGSGGYSNIEEMTLTLAADAVLDSYCSNLAGGSSPCELGARWDIADRSGNAQCLASHQVGCYVRVELRRSPESSFNGQNIYLREYNECAVGSYDPTAGGCIVMQPAAKVPEPEAQRTLQNMPAGLFTQYLQDMLDNAKKPVYFPDYDVMPEFDTQTLTPEPETVVTVRPDGKTETRTKTQTINVRPYIGPDGKVHFDVDGEEREEVYVDGSLESDITTPITPTTPTAPATGSYSCSNFQFICSFIDWIKDEETEQSEHPEIPVEYVEFIQEEYLIQGGEAGCPAPQVIVLGMFGEYQVPYDSFCQLAITVKPLYLTLMSLFAALIVYRGIV